MLGGRVAKRGRALPELDGLAGVALHRQAIPVQVTERELGVRGAVGLFSHRVRGTALQPRDARGLEVARVALHEHQLILHRLHEAFAPAGIADVEHQGLPAMRTVDDVIHPAREEAAVVQKRIPLLHRLAVVVLRRRRRRRLGHVGIGAEPDALFIRAFEEPYDDGRERQELALPRAAASNDADHGGLELVCPDLRDARVSRHELLVLDPLDPRARVVALDRLADVEAEEVEKVLVRAVLDEHLVLRRLRGADLVEQHVDPLQAVGPVVELALPECVEIRDAAGKFPAAV